MDVKICRIYERASTDGQDLTRQQAIEEQAESLGFHIAEVYKEKITGTTAERPELQRMIAALRPGEVVIAEKVDRISRLPLDQAEKLVETIKSKGVTLAIPDVVDLSDVIDGSRGMAKVVLEDVQRMLLRIALQMAREDWETRRERQRQGIAVAKDEGKYKGRKADVVTHERIVALRGAGHTIAKTAKLAGCSAALVKLIWARHKAAA